MCGNSRFMNQGGAVFLGLITQVRLRGQRGIFRAVQFRETKKPSGGNCVMDRFTSNFGEISLAEHVAGLVGLFLTNHRHHHRRHPHRLVGPVGLVHELAHVPVRQGVHPRPNP